MAGLGGKFYVVGGWNGFNGVASCEVFDPVTETWSFIADLHSGKLTGESDRLVRGHMSIIAMTTYSQ